MVWTDFPWLFHVKSGKNIVQRKKYVNIVCAGFAAKLDWKVQPRPQGFSLKKWFFWGKSPGDEVVKSFYLSESRHSGGHDTGCVAGNANITWYLENLLTRQKREKNMVIFWNLGFISNKGLQKASNCKNVGLWKGINPVSVSIFNAWGGLYRFLQSFSKRCCKSKSWYNFIYLHSMSNYKTAIAGGESKPQQLEMSGKQIIRQFWKTQKFLYTCVSNCTVVFLMSSRNSMRTWVHFRAMIFKVTARLDVDRTKSLIRYNDRLPHANVY